VRRSVAGVRRGALPDLIVFGADCVSVLVKSESGSIAYTRSRSICNGKEASNESKLTGVPVAPKDAAGRCG